MSTAMTRKAWNLAKDRLNLMLQTRVEHNPPPEVHEKIIVQALVHDHDVEACFRAYSMFTTHGPYNMIKRGMPDCTNIQIRIDLDSTKFAVPNYVHKTTSVDSRFYSSQLVQVLGPWMQRLLGDIEQATAVWRVLQHLDAACEKMEHMRFYFPGLVQLVGGPKGDRALVNRLAVARVPQRTVMLPPGFRDMCHDLTAWVTGSALLLEADTPKEAHPNPIGFFLDGGPETRSPGCANYPIDITPLRTYF